VRGDAPPLAVVEGVADEPAEIGDDTGFVIVATRAVGLVDVPVSADVAPCEPCLQEMGDPQDRRFRYPFVNCTDCGPRYTIVQAVPYDRPTTTMAPFAMCAACQAEYDAPADRRFHAQPNACPVCGPQLTWSSAELRAGGPATLEAAVACLRSGGVVGVKGVGGYHLACDAGDAAAVRLLRERKRREAKPFAVMVADLAGAEQLCRLDDAARAALVSVRRPVVLAPRRAGARVAAAVAPRLGELGVMLPSSPLHVLLVADVDRPLVMTSGNRSDEPVVHRDEEARERLRRVADGLLGHDREIAVRADDSVVRTSPTGRVQMVRRARGWTPQPLRLPVPTASPVLAVGAQLKSTVAIARGPSVVVSQHLGDLDNWSTFAAFTSAVEHLSRLSGVEPAVVAHDLHPDYRSTAWAVDSGLPLLGVQHHHAHVAACLAEHRVSTPVLGIAFDGLGLGPDGGAWGGELLLADLVGYQRLGHLATAALPGGDAAVREPWRMAVSWLHRTLGPEVAEEWGRHVDARSEAVLSVVRSLRSTETSSVGRLFDAVAALLGVRSQVTYEGQAAVELEALARTAGSTRSLDVRFRVENAVLDPGTALRDLLDARARGTAVDVLARAFHVGLAEATAELAARLASRHGLDTVALTGGVFQNVLLTDLLAADLRRAGLRVLLHDRLPPNDGSISVGQAAVAAARLNQGHSPGLAGSAAG
jgi:hydrogenase maturation protein HypF